MLRKVLCGNRAVAQSRLMLLSLLGMYAVNRNRAFPCRMPLSCSFSFCFAASQELQLIASPKWAPAVFVFVLRFLLGSSLLG